MFRNVFKINSKNDFGGSFSTVFKSKILFENLNVKNSFLSSFSINVLCIYLHCKKIYKIFFIFLIIIQNIL